MSSKNRNRLTISLDPHDVERLGNLWGQKLPAGIAKMYTVRGTVARGDDGGLLVQHKTTSVYCQWLSPALSVLDGRKVAAALGTAGRPQELQSGRAVNVYLDEDSLAKAKLLGGGVVSAGIRVALQKASVR